MRRSIIIALVLTAFAGLVSVPAQAAGCANAENDNFADAITITLLDHGDTCNNATATTEGATEQKPSCAPTAQGFGKTLWWKYTPTVATQSHVKVNTYQSVTPTNTTLNTVVALYKQTGSGLTGLVELACNDNVAANKGSRVTQALTLNTTYYVQVGTVNVVDGTVKFRMKPRTWKVAVTRGNDWYFNDLFDGSTDFHIAYGNDSDAKLAGNWAGHGVDTPWVRRGNIWLANDWFDTTSAKQFAYGAPSDRPFLGDWNGTDEILTPAVRRGNTWYFNNGLDGTADFSVVYGKSTDFPLVGDWDGNGSYTPGIRRGNVWYLNNNFDGVHDIAPFTFGKPTDFPVVGDWNADGKMTPGVVRGNTWYLNNGFDSASDITPFGFGVASDGKIVGDWNGIVE